VYAVDLGDGARLRPLEPWHAAELAAHMDRGRAFVGRFIGLPDVVTDTDSARAFLRSYAEKAAGDTGCIHGIWWREELVGGVLLRTMDLASGTAEAGCWLEPDAVGRGLVTRAARTLIDWAVLQRGIHRVEWRAASGNEASIAVARRLGMVKDGVLREEYPRHGVRHDIEVWSVLAPEWKDRRDETASQPG
jgi:ribosomal-protein-serine acetyltransferase